MLVSEAKNIQVLDWGNLAVEELYLEHEETSYEHLLRSNNMNNDSDMGSLTKQIKNTKKI